MNKITCWSCSNDISLKDISRNDGDCPECGAEIDMYTAYKALQRVFDEAKSEWISVDDKLPLSNKPVLVFYLSSGFKNPSINVALYFDGIEWRSLTGGHRFDNKPTHWMSLPEPPK